MPTNTSSNSVTSPSLDPASFNNQRYKVLINDNNIHHRFSRIIKLINKTPCHKLLDIGCGTGNLLDAINSTSIELTGIDISRDAINIAHAKGYDVRVADVEKPLPFPKNSFDLVIAGEIIEHLYDTDFFLSEISRILKPNGSLILSTPNLASLGRRLMLLFGVNPHIETSLSNGSAGHIRYFTHSSLVKLLSDHQFKPITFTSDIVNFTASGFGSTLLATLFPSLGASIIVSALNSK